MSKSDPYLAFYRIGDNGRYFFCMLIASHKVCDFFDALFFDRPGMILHFSFSSSALIEMRKCWKKCFSVKRTNVTHSLFYSSTTLVHRSEPAKRTVNAIYRPMVLPLGELCRGEVDAPIMIKCINWSNRGKCVDENLPPLPPLSRPPLTPLACRSDTPLFTIIYLPAQFSFDTSGFWTVA